MGTICPLDLITREAGVPFGFVDAVLPPEQDSAPIVLSLPVRTT
jgi:hypothetical protein